MSSYTCSSGPSAIVAGTSTVGSSLRRMRWQCGPARVVRTVHTSAGKEAASPAVEYFRAPLANWVGRRTASRGGTNRRKAPTGYSTLHHLPAHLLRLRTLNRSYILETKTDKMGVVLSNGKVRCAFVKLNGQKTSK